MLGCMYEEERGWVGTGTAPKWWKAEGRGTHRALG